MAETRFPIPPAPARKGCGQPQTPEVRVEPTELNHEEQARTLSVMLITRLEEEARKRAKKS